MTVEKGTGGDTVPRSEMARRLRAAIDEAGLSVRGFARVLAGADASNNEVESRRRQVNKYLAGTTPNDGQAVSLARALGKPDDYFVGLRPASARERNAATPAILERIEALERAVRASTGSAATTTPRETQDRLAAVEADVRGLLALAERRRVEQEAAGERLVRALDELADRVDALEQQEPPRKRGTQRDR